ncbi:MAG TPA: CotH kinase family protein [Planctomycetota bacterium]|nr:CotH kinase family protein [Planctomycetota bacterium]
MLRSLLAFACAGLLVAQQKPEPTDPDPARAFFAAGEVVHVEITLAETDRQHLRDKPREYVPATLCLDGKTALPRGGVKLKGAAGSFREIDDRPAFTVNLGKFGEPHLLHGLRRFHLNNGVQDDSMLCEWLGHEVFAAAGLPAPRVAHAIVTLDGRCLGLYVLREAFDRQFLLRTFGTCHGNLYDGGFCQDIDSDLEKDSGDGPDDRSDLRALLAACRSDDAERAARLEAVVDIAAFVDFTAIEAMLAHWDGYSQNRNNFRLWCETAPGRAHFLPHGMDQLLGEADASVLAHPSGIVASAVHREPAFRKLYRERLRALLPLMAPARWKGAIETLAARLQKELRAVDAAAAVQHAAAVRSLLGRLEARYKNLRVQVRAPEPKPLQFPGEKPIALKDWRSAAETDHVVLAKKGFQGVATLQIACQPGADEPRRAAWRTNVLLARGRYRLLATVRCDGIAVPPQEDGEAGGGVRLAVDDARSERLSGRQNWQQLTCEFEVGEFQRTVELELGLLAKAGTAWFRLDSLQIARVPQ